MKSNGKVTLRDDTMVGADGQGDFLDKKKSNVVRKKRPSTVPTWKLAVCIPPGADGLCKIRAACHFKRSSLCIPVRGICA